MTVKELISGIIAMRVKELDRQHPNGRRAYFDEIAEALSCVANGLPVETKLSRT